MLGSLWSRDIGKQKRVQLSLELTIHGDGNMNGLDCSSAKYEVPAEKLIKLDSDVNEHQPPPNPTN